MSAGDPAPLYLIGAPFQIKVWEALMAVPSGQVTTYSEIARAIAPLARASLENALQRDVLSLNFVLPSASMTRIHGSEEFSESCFLHLFQYHEFFAHFLTTELQILHAQACV